MKPEVECGVCLMHWVYGRVAPYTAKEALPGLARRLVDVLLRSGDALGQPGQPLQQRGGQRLCFTDSCCRPLRGAQEGEQRKCRGLAAPGQGVYRLRKNRRGKSWSGHAILAAASNVAPLNSPSGAYTFQEIKEIIGRDGFAQALTGDLYRAVRDADRILYITDNAGEIGFDSLVMDLIGRMGPRVTLVVKEKTFFEDATLEDARFFGLDKLADRVVTADGFFAPRAQPGDLRQIFAAE